MQGVKIPEFTILPDHNSACGTGGGGDVDYFNLEGRLGPMFDVLRHKDTGMPVSMAIYGGVGTGKTAALNWLERQVELWNAVPEAERSGHPFVVPVRFSARKCSCAATVPKKILTDILLQCMVYLDNKSSQQRVERVKMVAGQCRGALGRDFLLELECIARRWGVVETLRATTGDSQNEPVGETFYCEVFHDLLEDWLKEFGAQGSGVRVVVFIDDLDHVLPDVMMAVFEAIGLQLRSASIGFVAALDAHIAKTLVKQHFSLHDFGEMQCRNYLGKVFHVECDIEPSYQQIRVFYDAQYNLLDQKSAHRLSTHVSPGFKTHIDAAMIHLSSGNPRKIKLLLNSALMKGSAALRSGRAGEAAEENRALEFVQNIQIFLLQRWLSYFSVGGSAIYREDVLDWFEFLSCAAQSPTTNHGWIKERGKGEEDVFGVPAGMGLHMIHEWVWDLLRIPFSKTLASQCREDGGSAMEPAPRPPVPQGGGLREASSGFRETLAASLKKPVADLADEDAPKVVELDLTGYRFAESDLALLGKLENLWRLDLHNSSIPDLEPLAGLRRLKSLNLTCTPISDISPLNVLTELEVLDLSFSNVRDLSPLKDHPSLSSLVLYGTPVSDIHALKGLRKLSRLNLSQTGIADDQIEVLESLPALATLFLRETKVTSRRASQLNKAFDFNLKIES